MTFVTVSGPNFSGTRIVTGRKYTEAVVIQMSELFMDVMEILLLGIDFI
jgi:hypothetical protein